MRSNVLITDNFLVEKKVFFNHYAIMVKNSQKQNFWFPKQIIGDQNNRSLY